jgi:hypothetical protein
MKRNIFVVIALVITTAISSCSVFSSLTSTTTISPNNSFVLGNNEHGKFTVHIKNISGKTIEAVQKPIGGGSHSLQIIQPHESYTISVDANTALVIKNPSPNTINVKLNITGDTGLAMGYNKL